MQKEKTCLRLGELRVEPRQPNQKYILTHNTYSTGKIGPSGKPIRRGWQSYIRHTSCPRYRVRTKHKLDITMNELLIHRFRSSTACHYLEEVHHFHTTTQSGLSWYQDSWMMPSHMQLHQLHFERLS
jgi:hypothetical protein